MLNINQNFDLKAPVFNFDRDYFNSVEELNAYDTNNVPNHFVTNVAGMLYQFTDGAWVPMIQVSYGDPEDPEYHGCSLSLIDDNCFVSKNLDDNMYQLYLGTDDDTYVDISSSSSIEMKSTFSGYPQISINQEIDGVYKRMWIGNSWDTGFGLNIEHQKYLDSLLQYSKYIKIFIDKELTEEEQANGYSQVDISLTDANNSANINAGHGFMHKTEDGFTSHLDGEALDIRSQVGKGSINSQGLSVYDENNKPVICLQSFEENSLTLGSDKKFKISRQLDNTEGGVISGIKSLTSFANPSATKVWATDGSIANLPTKFSDLTNDSIYIKGNKGETDSRFKIHYKDGNILRSELNYDPSANTGIPEFDLLSYDTSGKRLSQIRMRPTDNKDDGQYIIQVQDVKGDKINHVSTLCTENFQNLNTEDNTAVSLSSNELGFYTTSNGVQIQLKIDKEGITKTNGKATEVFAANGSVIDLTTYTNYFNGTTTADKLKSKAVEVTDDTNSVTVSPTGITATNGNTEGSIKMLTNKELTEEEQANGYSQVDISLTDSNNSASINPGHGFTYTNQNLRTSVNSEGLTVETLDLTTEGSGIMSITHNSINATEPAGSARLAILPNKINITGAYENTLTIEAPYSSDDYSEISLRREPDTETTINAEDGFIQTGPVCTGFGECQTQLVQLNRANIHFYKKDQSKQQTNAKLGFNKLENFLLLGNDQKFEISRPVDDTEGATITGVKSIVAFSDPSNTKVFATDGSIVDLSTKADASDLDAKANASDVLLKKSATGGYYIEANSNDLGQKAFAANEYCTASGHRSFAEGYATEARERQCHAEGYYTIASGHVSHAEGESIVAKGYCSHAQGRYNIGDIDAIHSIGIGNSKVRKNAEYIYVKNNDDGTAFVDDPKNGYKYLIGVGGYDGISTDNTTYKSVQEVIADLTARIEQLETKVKALEAANTPA